MQYRRRSTLPMTVYEWKAQLTGQHLLAAVLFKNNCNKHMWWEGIVATAYSLSFPWHGISDPITPKLNWVIRWTMAWLNKTNGLHLLHVIFFMPFYSSPSTYTPLQKSLSGSGWNSDISLAFSIIHYSTVHAICFPFMNLSSRESSRTYI